MEEHHHEGGGSQHHHHNQHRRSRRSTSSPSSDKQHLKHRTTQGPITEPVQYTSFLCGLLAGIAQAGVFNPYDRALYLSVRDHRRFLSWENWKNPYNGFVQSIGGRALSGGLYFPLEHLFLRALDEDNYYCSPLHNFIAGTAAGAVNACVLNPLSAIKYKTWGRHENRGMVTEAVRMLQKSGSVQPFLNGLRPTLYRDVVFGGCYTWLRLQIQWWFQLQPHQQWMANLIAAGFATALSGPFNYVRTIQYATSSRVSAAGTWQILEDLAEQTSRQQLMHERVLFLAKRLRIGWGTLRVAIGMSFAHAVYDWLHENLKPPIAVHVS